MEKSMVIENSLKAMFDIFRINSEPTYRLYLNSILERDLDEEVVKNVLKEMSESFKTMPSLVHVLDEVREASKGRTQSTPHLKEENERKLQVASELRTFEQNKTEFERRYPGKALKDYVKYWFINVYSEKAYIELDMYHFELKNFGRPALADLKEASWSPEEAIKVGKKNNQKAWQEKDNQYKNIVQKISKDVKDWRN